MCVWCCVGAPVCVCVHVCVGVCTIPCNSEHVSRISASCSSTPGERKAAQERENVRARQALIFKPHAGCYWCPCGRVMRERVPQRAAVVAAAVEYTGVCGCARERYGSKQCRYASPPHLRCGATVRNTCENLRSRVAEHVCLSAAGVSGEHLFFPFFFLRLEKVRVRVRGRGKERACAYDDVRFGIDYLPARRALCALRVLRISCIGVHILYRY